MQNLIDGLGALAGVGALAYLFGGAVLGMFIGMLPGGTTVVTLSIILVFSYHLNLTDALCLFLGAQSGGFYSGSIAAILINAPPHPEALPITFDGYPMARAGNPGRALGLSAGSTCVGGFIGCAVLVGCLPFMNDLGNLFHPPDLTALIVLAILLVGGLGTDSIRKAIVASAAGLLASTVGPSAITGTFRYTFGALGLQQGLSLVAVALGVFVIPQMVMVFGTGTATAFQDMTGRAVGRAEAVGLETGNYYRSVIGGVLETFRHWGMLLESGIVGAITGMIPGIGGFAGNYMAYGFARQTSRNRKNFGTGAPEGIIGPEGSSLAKEAGHVIPIIGLGIPGGIAGALFIGLFDIQGIRVGYGFQQAHPGVTGEIVWIIALSGLIGTLIGVIIGPRIAAVTRIPGPLITPFAFAICVLGVFLTDQLFFSVGELFVFAIVGLALRRLRYPLGGFALGFVLGPTLEQNIYLTHAVYPGLSFIGARPLADAIAALAVVFVVAKWIETRRESKGRGGALKASPHAVETQELAAEGARADSLPGLPGRAGTPSGSGGAEERAEVPAGAEVVAAPTAGGDPLELVGRADEVPREELEGGGPWVVRSADRAAVLMDGAAAAARDSVAAPVDQVERRSPDYPLLTIIVEIAALAIALPAGIYAWRAWDTRTNLLPIISAAAIAIPILSMLPRDARNYWLFRRKSVRAHRSDVTSRGGVVDRGQGSELGAPAERGTVAPVAEAVRMVEERSWGRNGQYRRELSAVAWLLALIGVVWLIGFTVGIAVFMVAFCAVAVRRYFRSQLRHAIFVVLGTAVMCGFVYVMLRVSGTIFTPIW
jgi:putative tricarboxylic transport membrane protein